MSCDLIAEVKLHQLADIHRTYDATITVLLASNENKEKENEENTKTKTKKDGLSELKISTIFSLLNLSNLKLMWSHVITLVRYVTGKMRKINR